MSKYNTTFGVEQPTRRERHIDRDTGRLQDCFLPRFALIETGEHEAQSGRTT